MTDCDIIKHCKDLSERLSGWKKELNLVSWFGREAKYDIREWNEDHSKCGKGTQISEDELFELYLYLKELFKEKPYNENKKPIEDCFFKKTNNGENS